MPGSDVLHLLEIVFETHDDFVVVNWSAEIEVSLSIRRCQAGRVSTHIWFDVVGMIGGRRVVIVEKPRVQRESQALL